MSISGVQSPKRNAKYFGSMKPFLEGDWTPMKSDGLNKNPLVQRLLYVQMPEKNEWILSS